MSIFNSTDVTMKYRYQVSEFTVIVPASEKSASMTYALPKERIVSIGIFHDYEGMAFPVLKITTVLEANMYRIIMKNKDSVKFKIRIQKYYTDASGKNPSLMRDSINDQFDLIMNDDYADTDSVLRAEGTKMNLDTKNTEKSLDNDDLFAIDNTIDFFLFKSETIMKTKTDANNVLQNASVSDAVGYIISKTKLKNFLVSPIKNKTIHKELFIPPGKASNALCFIDSYYGLYPTGSIIYFDFNRAYILEFTDKCTAYEPNENKEITILMPVRSSEHDIVMCSLRRSVKDKIDYVVGNPQTFSPSNESVSYDITNGTSATVIDNTKGSVESVTPNKVKTKNNSSTNKTIFENKTENPYISQTYNAQMNSIALVLNIDLGDFDMDIIAPNKKVNIIFEDSSLSIKYKGSYKIAKATHEFTKNGNDFQISTKLVLKKMN